MQSVCAILYRHLRPVWLYHTLPDYLINGTIFGRKNLNIKCVFWCSLNSHLNHFSFYEEFSEIWSQIYPDLHVKCPLLLSDVNEILLLSTDFRKKHSNIKFHENPSSVRRAVPCGWTGRRTDKHDEGDTRFSQFCESVSTLKKIAA